MSRALRALFALVLGVTVLLVSSPAQAVTVLRYDASRAAEFRGVVDQAAQIWNSSVTNVRLEPGTPAHFIVYADNGWPRAMPTSLGRGYVWMGRQATAQGHNALRIATHEIGHILGLPDRRTGRCTDLMSGASAGTSCTNPYPNAAEKAEVNGNFAGASPRVEFGQVHVNR
ncbi:snapalysin family zinc-dependent metalloprotease [Nonomuraea sp. ATR24]|uniref:snapalysin family zinc-dependent metalloprotease n=1 Tax=Nonomuraea TaxID=83681 RepID=UPI001C5EDD17|nr:snapalysin family zinc-dependent metalloprotease [Nonomuraea ceibae]